MRINPGNQRDEQITFLLKYHDTKVYKLHRFKCCMTQTNKNSCLDKRDWLDTEAATDKNNKMNSVVVKRNPYPRCRQYKYVLYIQLHAQSYVYRHHCTIGHQLSKVSLLSRSDSFVTLIKPPSLSGRWLRKQNWVYAVTVPELHLPAAGLLQSAGQSNIVQSKRERSALLRASVSWRWWRWLWQDTAYSKWLLAAMWL